jgi:predicted dehydrogenase
MELPLSWGILGTGKVAQDFVQALRHCDQANLLAVASRDRRRAQEFARLSGAKRAFDNYSEMLALPDLDIIYIATPNHRHKDDCIQAIAAAKNVLCEKPLALNAAEARLISNAARSAGVFCMEGMWTHFIPAVYEAERLLKSGSIGTPVMVSGSFGLPTKFCKDSRFFNAELGGGALLDRACYPISLALRFLGRAESVAGKCLFAETGVDSTAAAVIQFAEGKIAVIEASITSYQANNLVISATAGRIVLHEPITRPHMLSLTLVDGTGTAPASSIIKTGRRAIVRFFGNRRSFSIINFVIRGLPRVIAYKGNGFVHEVEEVHRCIRMGKTESEIMPLDRSIATLEIIDAILKSAYQHAKA